MMAIFTALFMFLMGNYRPLFHIFSVFSNNSTIFTTNKSEKLIIRIGYGAGIQTRVLLKMSLQP